MARMVLLKHELPDGSFHYDWMLQRDDAATALITFRVAQRIDVPSLRVFDAERIGEHRAAYLEYQGPVGAPVAPGDAGESPLAMGERGRVIRVARGECRVEHESETQINIRSRFIDQAWRQWCGTRVDAQPGAGARSFRFFSCD